jgi:hypothetical protein
MTFELMQFILMVVRGIMLLTIFLLASMSMYALFVSLLGKNAPKGIVLGLSLIIGPMLLSWFNIMLLYFFAEHTSKFYVWWLAFAFGVPGIIATFRHGPNLWGTYSDMLATFAQDKVKSRIYYLFLTLVILAMGQLLLTQLFIPLSANDPLEYASVSRLIATLHSARDYPFMDRTLTGGLYAGWTHPLGYAGLLSYAFMLQGPAVENAGIIKFVAPYYVFAQAILIMAFAGWKRPLAGPVAAFILLATPIYFHLASQAHIDISRLATMTAAVVSVWLLAANGNLRHALIAILAIGMAQFSHSIGLLTLPLVIPLYLLISKSSWIITIRNSALLIFGSLLFVALRLIINIKTIGAPLGDYVKIWTFPNIKAEHHLQVVRHLESLYDKIINGMMSGWSSLEMFYIFHWALTGALVIAVIYFRKQIMQPVSLVKNMFWKNEDPVFAALIIIMGFYAMLALTIMAGTELAIKNVRYTMTVQPLLAVALARLLVWFMDLKRSQSPKQIRTKKARKKADATAKAKAAGAGA